MSRRVPREGATAWADSWLLAKQARHPNCAYLWLRHVLGPDVQASQSLLLRESPVNPLACPIMDATEEGSCAAYYGSAPAALLAAHILEDARGPLWLRRPHRLRPVQALAARVGERRRVIALGFSGREEVVRWL